MTTRSFRICSFFFLVLLAISAADIEFLVMGQEPTNQNEATNAQPTTTPTPQRRRGRGRRRPPAEAMPPDTAAPATTPETPAITAMPASHSEQTDLSGTYTGTFDCGDAGVTGPTTLTVTGNEFTLADGKKGRLVASTTQGYTGVAMQFGEMVMATPGQTPGPAPMIVSMRARKSGDRLTLSSVPGATHVCSFTPTGVRTRHRRSSKAATPAMPAEPAMPAAATETPATPAEPATPATPRRGRRGKRNTNTNMNSNTNSNMNDNTGTGEGNMNTKPTPTPPGSPHN